jgi:molecular chaperone DnaK
VSHVIGIDLGTTNCCVAVLSESTPTVLSNRQGYSVTPSIVAVSDGGERVVGQIAVRQAVTNPKQTVFGTKRLIGRLYDSEEVQDAMKRVPFGIVPGPHGDTRIVLGDKFYSPAEIAAMFLQEMRVVAEEALGEPVAQAVVTVPAYFTDNQRQAVKDAGRIAGLDVLRIINEPTAAALAYGFNKGEDKTIAVYDLGGGTFDISIVRLTPDGTFTVVSTLGDSYLGGEDFDDRIMEWLIKGFEAEHSIDLSKQPIALARLKEAARKAKCDLSDLSSVDIQLPFIVSSGPSGPLHMDYTMSRDHLEKLTNDLVTRTLRICERAMSKAELDATQIHEVILVGGMTRMPAVQFAVKEFFGREPCKGVHPDEVVALGAAIAGGALTEKVDSINLKDVTAHSLGIMTAGGGFDVLIHSNTPVPTQFENEFTTSRDFQDTVKIIVLQGESARAVENDALGQFALTGLRSAPAGEVDVVVSFQINEDGIFSVAARDKETGEQQGIEVTASSGLTEEEIEEMMRASHQFLASRRAGEHEERVRQTAEAAVAEVERLLPEAERRVSWTPAGTTTITRARELLEESRWHLAANDVEGLEQQLPRLDGIRSLLEKVLRGDESA